jgi:hypothetical protein
LLVVLAEPAQLAVEVRKRFGIDLIGDRRTG